MSELLCSTIFIPTTRNAAVLDVLAHDGDRAPCLEVMIQTFAILDTHTNVAPLSSFTAAEYPQTERGNIAFRVSASSWAKQHIEGCIYVVVFVGKIKTINTKGRVKFNFCVWGKTYFHETEPHIYDELHLFFLLRKLSKSLSVYD